MKQLRKECEESQTASLHEAAKTYGVAPSSFQVGATVQVLEDFNVGNITLKRGRQDRHRLIDKQQLEIFKEPCFH